MRLLTKMVVAGGTAYLIGEFVSTVRRVLKEIHEENEVDTEDYTIPEGPKIDEGEGEEYVTYHEVTEVPDPSIYDEELTITSNVYTDPWNVENEKQVMTILVSYTLEELKNIMYDTTSDEAWVQYQAYRLAGVESDAILKIMIGLFNCEYVYQPRDEIIIDNIESARLAFFKSDLGLVKPTFGEVIMYFAELMEFDLGGDSVDTWLELLLKNMEVDLDRPELIDGNWLSRVISSGSYYNDKHLFGMFGLDDAENGDLNRLGLLQQYHLYLPEFD